MSGKPRPRKEDPELLLEFERQCWARGFSRVAGVDEAGRGTLAGPVVAAAVIFPREFLECEEHGLLEGLTDSKQLSPSRREVFYTRLTSLPEVHIGLGLAEAAEIDRTDILRATHVAMLRALAQLPWPPDFLLVDGGLTLGLPPPVQAVVRGDGRSLSIAAASVVAKVARDRQMRELDSRFPQYGFASHKGYGTRSHVQALLEYGPCPVHRRTFRPVREAEHIYRLSCLEASAVRG